MNERKNEITTYLENISLLLLGITLVSFPLIFSTSTTDPFALPKQILFAVNTLIALVFLGARMISEGSVKIRRTPFDLPLILFALVTLISAAISVNRADAMIAYVPFFFIILAYFLIVNFVKKESSLTFLLTALMIGTSFTALITVFSYFKIYPLPFDFSKVQYFTPLGTLFDQAIYFAMVLPIAGYFTFKLRRAQTSQDSLIKPLGFTVAFVIIAAGLITTTYQLFTTQKPLILPFETGFQTAFAAISQDTGRVAQGFFFGSGFGTYMNDFTRFKQATFNSNPTLWGITFTHSSSFVLELLATTGMLGVLSFLLLVATIIKESKKINVVKENPLYVALLLGVVLAFILPFSFVMQALFIIILAIFAAAQGVYGHVEKEHAYFDMEFYFVAFIKGIGILPLNETETNKEERRVSYILPVVFFILFIVLSGGLGYLVFSYVRADMTFQKSLVAASQNNAIQTYNDQNNAINTFQYRDAYYRIYSQTNLAIANALAANLPTDGTQNQETQQTIYNLIQQSIDAARKATILSPLTAANWQNLASVYRSLIGFGQNAENFSVLATQQSIALDSNNPQQYLNLGGIYYQLGQWDNAINQFTIAINLKPDFANAHYNLGHALEQKGDLPNALARYQAVKTLIANDKEATKQIDAEIKAIQDKIAANQAATQQQEQAANPANGQSPIGLNAPQTQLPQRNPQVPLTSPTATPTPKK